METIKKSLDVYEKVATLKNDERLRQGWIKREVPGRIESVAEHCFDMLNLAILISKQFSLNLDMVKVYEMIGTHEYGEIKIGDIIPSDGISKEEKYKRELDAIEELLDGHPSKEELVGLWKEFESQSSDEALFVVLLDGFQSVLQAKRYSIECNRPEIFDEFNKWYLEILSIKSEENSQSWVKKLTI